MKEIDFLKVLKHLLSKFLIVLVCGAICAGIGLGYSLIIEKPTYRTSTTILVNNGGLSDEYNGSSIVSGSNITASLALVSTSVDILKCDNIYKDLSSSIDNKYSYYELQDLFYVRARSEASLLIDIYTFSSNPAEAKTLANKFLEIVPTYLSNTITNADVKILATADTVKKTGPQTLLNVGKGFSAGVIISIAVVLILFFFKNTIDSEKDFKKNYNIPLLGTIPYFENTKTGGKRNVKFRKRS